MPSDRTRAAVFAAMDAATTEGDDHAWAVLDALLGALISGHEESLANAVGEWDADQEEGEPVLPAWSRPHDGRPS